jgi:hypothetical protein
MIRRMKEGQLKSRCWEKDKIAFVAELGYLRCADNV